MSMTTLVILRFAGIFAAYTGLTVLLPAIMFRRILVGRGLNSERRELNLSIRFTV